MKISIITPTVRAPNGLKTVEKALDRQTCQDFEFIVQEKTAHDGIWSLNRDYNAAIKRAKADLIISWQDYTFARPDTLEKFLFLHEIDPKTLVTGVGNKYLDDSWTTITWKDPRERDDQGTYYPCFWNDIELNLCSIPKQALYDVGGFDEALDFLGYGLDGISVLDRINMLKKYDFKINQDIKSFSLVHDRYKDWEEKNLINKDGSFGEKYNKRRIDYVANPKLPYLD